MKPALLAAAMLWKREMIRFWRQPSRVAGALGSPIIFWLFIGAGFGSSFQAGTGDTNYLAYFYPGTLYLILLFTAVFSTFSLIQDRQEGFMQSVLVAPVPSWSLALGKILGGAGLAWLQGLFFLALAPVAGFSLSPAAILQVAGILFLNAFFLTAGGFLLAWRMNSIQGFHAVMNLLLMPLWFLSGALFPLEGAPVWIRVLMQVNPLTYGLGALRQVLSGPEAFPLLPDAALSCAVTAGLAVISLLLAARFAAERGPEQLT